MQRTPTDVQGVREMLGARSDAAIYKKVARREIPFRKVGSRLVFFREEVLEWLDSQPGVRVEDLEKQVR